MDFNDFSDLIDEARSADQRGIGYADTAITGQWSGYAFGNCTTASLGQSSTCST